MLSRALRPRIRRDALCSTSKPTVAEQLVLPWLCPAQMRWAARIATSGTNPSSDARKSHRIHPSVASPRRDARSLATATEFASATTPAFVFEGLSRAFATRQPDAQLTKLQPWDTARPLVLEEPLTPNTVPATPVRYGIGGDPVELHQNLYACLRVGRMDRALAILERLTAMYNPAATDVVDAHNIYLQTMFELAEQMPSERGMREIEEFYETNMVGKGIEPNAQTLVTLLRAAMNLLPEGMREDAIHKYLDLARTSGPVILEEVNASPDFSDEEWDTLIRLQSDLFEEPPHTESADPIQARTPEKVALAIQNGFIPDVLAPLKPVEQKGLGLTTLKKSLSVFEALEPVPYPHEMEGTKEDKDRAYAYMRQIRAERDAVRAATERWKAEDMKLQEMGIHGVLQTKPIQALMWNWYSTLVPSLEEELKKVKEVLSNPCDANMRDHRHIYGTYFEMIPLETMAAVAIMRLLTTAADSSRENSVGLKVSAITSAIGMDIEVAYQANAKERHDNFLKKQRKHTRRELLNQLSKEKTPIESEGRHLATPAPHVVDSYLKKHFPLPVKVRLGALLLDHLVQSATITVSREDPKTGKKLTRTQPAFHSKTIFSQGKKTAFIVPHEEITRKLRSETLSDLHAVRLPMLIEPKPWTAFDEGGYYTIKEPAVRTKVRDRSQHAYAISAIENGDMKQVLAGLDTLGKVPWKINQDVYKVMAECWNAGAGVAGLVPEHPGIPCPVEPSPTAPYQERYQYMKRRKEYENTISGLHSQRCFQNLQLEVARAFLNETMYFPHSVDFRGRAYPIPPVLNHMGSDLTRGLLMFGNGRMLGEVGLQWLKVHLANLYGYDKASLKEREQFAMDNIKDIYDSANNPLNGNRWWTKADDPWQCLACCIELRNALESADPTRYISHLPVHQDGTCNGLQHYAALGGDEAGASQVNLEPSDKPQDIYTGVAEIVKELVAEDTKAGSQVAAFVNGKITRSVVKRTVMTNVYGVTFIGAKMQVLDELKVIFPDFQPQEDMPNLEIPASYIAKQIFVALGRIFNGAQEIQCWLGECGDRITSSISAEQIQRLKDRFEGKPVAFADKYNNKRHTSERILKKLARDMDIFKTGIIWTTPLKMPVVQHYRKDNTRVVKAGTTNITIASTSRSGEVNKRKQLQAFPPNFIHSLDATHMILSALKCAEIGMDFAAVHDSFWTHAADIPKLNVVLRDAFVRMHSEDIVGRLAAEFKARYAGAMYLAGIDPKSSVAAKIQRWRSANRFWRSAHPQAEKGFETIHMELALEAERQELLKSEDPEQRWKGEEMVTPTSIFLKHGDSKALNSFRLALLGEVSASRAGSKSNKVKEKLLEAEAETAGVEPVAAEEIVEEEEVAEEEEAEEEEEANESLAEDDMEAAPKKKRTSRLTRFRVWLPLTFPPVPEKGSWDVRRLHESKYFFS